MAKSRRMYDRIVSTQNRFSGQNAWVPYFWEAIADEEIQPTQLHGLDVYVIEVYETDRQVFPELNIGQQILLYDDGDFIIELDPRQLTDDNIDETK